MLDGRKTVASGKASITRFSPFCCKLIRQLARTPIQRTLELETGSYLCAELVGASLHHDAGSVEAGCKVRDMHQALNPHLSADVRKRARKHAVNKIVREISEKHNKAKKLLFNPTRCQNQSCWFIESMCTYLLCTIFPTQLMTTLEYLRHFRMESSSRMLTGCRRNSLQSSAQTSLVINVQDIFSPQTESGRDLLIS